MAPSFSATIHAYGASEGPARSTTPLWLARALLVLASASLTLALSLPLYRALHARLARPQLPVPTPGLHLPDPVLGWRNAPGRHEYARWGATIEPDGLRAGPRSEVLVLGDSYAFGWGVEDSEAWPARAGLTNGGVSGYSLAQIVLLGEQLVPELRPRTIVLALIPDDVQRLSLGRAEPNRPAFVLDTGRLAFIPPEPLDLGAVAAALVRRLSRLTPRLLLVFYGRPGDRRLPLAALRGLAPTLNLCDLLTWDHCLPADRDPFRHPNAAGHALIARRVAEALHP